VFFEYIRLFFSGVFFFDNSINDGTVACDMSDAGDFVFEQSWNVVSKELSRTDDDVFADQRSIAQDIEGGMVTMEVPASMVPMIEMLMSDPEVYRDIGYDGQMAGPYAGYSRERPDMSELSERHYEGEEPPNPDFMGDYEGEDIYGTLDKIKLMDMLRGLM
jgi:hypothetical protein